MDKTFTNYNKDEIEFEILVDELFNNGALLSLINDFESYKWRDEKFINFIIDSLQFTALSAEEREKIIEKPHSAIKKAIKNLNLNQNGGEIGEIFLYGIMKNYYNALPIVPKIFWKQNKNDYAKGADSIHITINDGVCHLWLGESKIYADLKSAFNAALSSIKELLEDEKLKKENLIITNLDDLEIIGNKHEYKDVIIKFKKWLKNEISLDEIKKILHIPVSIVYQCSETASVKEINEDYKEKIKQLHTKESNLFLDSIIKTLNVIPHIDKIRFHIILFPVPNKENLINDILTKMKAIKQ